MTKNVWILIDDRAGSNNQARGVAAALGWNIVEKKISYNRWANLPNLFLGAGLLGIDEASKQAVQGPFPDLVIAASRRAAPVARWIKKHSLKQTKIVQIMHPGNVGLNDFDKIFVSEHDLHKKQSANMYFITGSAHRITAETLADAKEKWQQDFAHLPRPLTAVIVGGSYKGHEFSRENAIALGQQISRYKQSQGGSILITDSRRTGSVAQNAIMQEIKDIPSYRYLWGNNDGKNPYIGFLACADDIIVTGDSVSMCCEACGAGKKVQIFCGERWLDKKHWSFINSLLQRKLAFLLGDEIPADVTWSHHNPANEIAEQIRKLFIN